MFGFDSAARWLAIALALWVLVGAIVVPGAAQTSGDVDSATRSTGEPLPPGIDRPSVGAASAPELTQSQPDDGAATDGAEIEATIVAVYPNPTRPEDAGEFVRVRLPRGANASAFTITDGETTVRLGAAPTGVVVTVASDDRARALATSPTVNASLALSNAGERLKLLRNGSVVDERRYRDAPEGAVGRWPEGRVKWKPLGATDRRVVTAGSGTVRAFVLPDAPAVPLATVRNASDRLYLAGYTLTAEPIADALIAAHRRGVDVRVLLEGQPVGERTRRGARTLDRLVEAGVSVRVVGGPLARYEYHHAKYAVVDDRGIVLTENWKPSGTGGNSSRGWGAVTNQSAIVSGLAETFRADAGWRDARPWSAFREGRTYDRGGVSRGGYDQQFAPEQLRVESTRLLVTPDNAEGELVATIDDASKSVDVIQMSIGWDAPPVVALRRAAARGVDVRILLSSTWYVKEDNRRFAERAREWARHNDADLSVRLAEPGGRYGKIHAKGAVVDDDTVVLGSLNWNSQSARVNREVILVMRGGTVAGYYGRVFDADWRGGRPRLPLGLAGGVGGVVLVAVLVGRRVAFRQRCRSAFRADTSETDPETESVGRRDDRRV